MVQRVMIVAGETSGDIHGAGVVRELKRKNPSIEIFGIGGDNMAREGMTLTYHVGELAFMGFMEVVKHLPLIRSVEKTLEQLLRLKKPEVVLLIDYPGFNLRFARTAKRLGAHVVYYISPQVWAWKKGRVKKMRGVIDRMLVVFPFEEEIYLKEGVPVSFVGHPLAEELGQTVPREEFFQQKGFDGNRKILAIIPGSRKQEIKHLLSVMTRAGEILAEEFEMTAVVTCAPNLSINVYRQFLPPGVAVKFVEGATHEIMKYADAALVTSGTATLETAWFETPMVIIYKTSWITYFIGRMLVRVRNIGLVNIVSGKTIVPELIQHHANVPSIVHTMRELLRDGKKLEEIRERLHGVKEKLGGPGASEKVADVVLRMV